MFEFLNNITVTQWWFIFLVILLIMEIFVPALIMLSLSAGCLLGFISSYLGLDMWLQVVTASLGSLLMLFSIRPLVLRLSKNKKGEKSNVDAMIGKEVRVVEEINYKKGIGKISYFGDRFQAINKENIVIKEGELVKIIKVDSIIVFVEPLKIK